jgi:3-hydroxy-9,10-secoandrosta-1,3,5(10)-triene-9,17-dione monooxygenase
MERMFRDAHAIQSHIAFSFDVSGAAAGKYALGLGSDNPML